MNFLQKTWRDKRKIYIEENGDKVEMHPILFYAYCIKELAGVILFGALINWFGISRILNMFNEPDFNRDGAFTISDLTSHISDIYFVSGDIFLSWLATTEVGVFFEMSVAHPSGLLSGIINFLTWGVIWIGIHSVYRLARHHDGDMWV